MIQWLLKPEVSPEAVFCYTVCIKANTGTHHLKTIVSAVVTQMCFVFVFFPKKRAHFYFPCQIISVQPTQYCSPIVQNATHCKRPNYIYLALASLCYQVYEDLTFSNTQKTFLKT